jgi:hypothetical protein
MMRLAVGIEGLDDEHAAAAAGARACERLCRIGFARLLGRSLLGRTWAEVQEIAQVRDGLGAIAAGEQAVVADAVEALDRTWMRDRWMNSSTSSVIAV